DGLEEHGGRWYTHDEWIAVSAEKRREAADADAVLAAKRNAARGNAAVRAMLSPDPVLRAKGRKALEDLATETKLPAYQRLADAVADYAAASDRMLAAYGGGGDTSVVLAECRIQMAKLKRPIETLSTSLGSNIGGGGVKIQ